MKDIDIKDIKHLAELSALEFSDEELLQFVPEFNNILSMINEINQVNVDSGLVINNAVDVSDLRADEVQESMPQDLALINAPKQRKGCFNVPRVVD